MTFARLILLSVILSLGLSTVGFGVARGHAPAAGQMVICTGHGIVTVTIDADGNPVTTQTLCPDAALSALAATPSPSAEVVAPERPRAWRQWPGQDLGGLPRQNIARGARAPPV